MKFLFYALYGCNLLLLLGGLLLPSSVAVHFSLSGEPDRWMNRDVFLLSWALYCSFMALLFALGASGKMPLSSRFCNIPSKKYWLNPSRIDKARTMLSRLLYEGGTGLFLFLGGLFLLLLQAHAKQPPLLSLPLFFLLLAIFLGGLLFWILRFYRAFRPPRTNIEE